MNSFRNHQSQKLVPLYTERLRDTHNIAQNMPHAIAKVEFRRNLSKKYFKARSSSINLLASKSLKPDYKPESITKILSNYLEKCAPYETLELTEPKEEAWMKCARIETNMKKKIDFFFKPYAQTSDAKENFHMLSNFEPIHFDNPVSPKKSIENEEKYFHKKAIDKWNNLSNTIFKKDNGKLRKLLYTMNGDMYHQLKEFAQNLNSKSGKKQSSANRSINQSDMSNQSSFIKEGYKMLDNIISKEKKVVFKEDKNHLNVNSLNDFKLLKKQSIITPLMMLKRGQTNNKRHSVKKSKRPSFLATVSEFKTKSDKIKYNKDNKEKSNFIASCSNVPKLTITKACMYKDIDNLQGSACNYNQGFLTKRNSSNSFKSTMESCKSSQDQNKHSEMKSQDKKKSGSKWNIEGSLSSLDSVSNSSEASINEDAQPNVNHRCQYNNLMNRRMSEAGPRYRKMYIEYISYMNKYRDNSLVIFIFEYTVKPFV